jgi:5-methylthioadenosine/S-adenosylhomocysteine deaminase
MRLLLCRTPRSFVFSGSLVLTCLLGATAPRVLARQAVDQTAGILLRGTVVTMDDKGTILPSGNVLVRDGRITAVWQGKKLPAGVSLDNAIAPDLGTNALIFPGLLDLHDHPNFDALHVWPPPSSHMQPELGRPLGTEPYAYRYQWNRMLGLQPPEASRLIEFPTTYLTELLPLGASVGKYAEVKAVLGGETTFQGAENGATAGVLIRNVEQANFGQAGRIDSNVGRIDDPGFNAAAVLQKMQSGELDAWIVHLAEGVRDSQRRPGDSFSSRQEFATLTSMGLLTDMTVIVHGTGLEPDDFATMRRAASNRTDGTGDGLGAKLVWSPLSNLLLYGQTALVYHALKAGVTVSLGTDWSPSGSRTLLDELKIADITLRDSRLLGADRDLIPWLSTTGKPAPLAFAAEAALDRLLVQMVTSNPAKTLRWFDKVGSIEVGKAADVVVIRRPDHPSSTSVLNTPYRNLIDATDKDVRLVLVDGQPLAGDVSIMQTLKGSDYEIVASQAGCFSKAVDVTNLQVSGGDRTLANIKGQLAAVLQLLGGDNPPPDGGPAELSNTYHGLKHLFGLDALSDNAFLTLLISYVGLTPDGRLNIEAVKLSPLFVQDDDFYFHLMGADLSPSGLIADPTPPFGLYPTNFNHVGSMQLGNPFAASLYRDRYYSFCTP